MFAPVQPAQLTFPGTYPTTDRTGRKQADSDTYAAVGMIGVGGFLAGVGVATAIRKMKSQSAHETSGSASAEKEQCNDTPRN